MRATKLLCTVLWALAVARSPVQAGEAILYSRQVQGEKRADAAELAKSYYQLESIAVADHRPVPGAAPRVVFSFKHSRRGVSDHGSILNPVLHPTKPILLFTSDHDQERSLFKSNAFMVGTSGDAYLQLSPYRSNGRWPATGDRTGTVVGRVNGPVAPEGGALVFLEGVAAPAATDSTGRFVFRNVPAGDGLHLVAWKMSLHDPEVVRHYLSDFNFGSTSVTVAPGATVQTAVTLAYRGFGYGGQDNSRSYLEYATWGPGNSAFAVFGEKVIYQVFPTCRVVKEMGGFTRGIAYHPGRKQWAMLTGGSVVVADEQFRPVRTLLTGQQLQGWLRDSWSQLGSLGLHNSCIRWSPSGGQVAFEIAGGRGVMVYDFASNRLHLPAWSQDSSLEYRVGSFSPDGAFVVITAQRKAASNATQLVAVRWARPQEAHVVVTAAGIQRACWAPAAKP